MSYTEYTKSRRLKEKIAILILKSIALISVITTIAILSFLILETFNFFTTEMEDGGFVKPWDFLFGTKWTPLFKPQSFGILPLVAGTLLVTVIAVTVAIILGLSTAIFLSEYAPENLRRVIKPILEILAGIPTVVYGYFALTCITPILIDFSEVFGLSMIIFNALSAGLVMGIMITPMVSTISEDALISVPQHLRDASYAMGAKKFQTAFRVVVPAALSGIAASLVLGISRAIGETMIVTIAAGSTPNFTLNPLESIQAMTAFVVQISLGEAPHGSLEYTTIFAVGLVLFLMTLSLNIFGKWLVNRYSENY
ncbi:MAG: phosphate ABC transporter permease subunit PstC [Chloroflexota bacterium]|nr:phosphate ABC transporter permease subunit PstC [Chloroflexota bacterium]